MEQKALSGGAPHSAAERRARRAALLCAQARVYRHPLYERVRVHEFIDAKLADSRKKVAEARRNEKRERTGAGSWYEIFAERLANTERLKALVKRMKDWEYIQKLPSFFLRCGLPSFVIYR